MPTHWTYRDFAPTDGLFQGDIIAREPLLEVLGNVHKHFCDPKYLAFIVLTQTCDLVVRNKACKAKHIALAVVRPLSALVPGVLSDMCSSPRSGLFPQDRRKAVEEFFHRVLNQNEQAEGWVYLHPDGDIGIGEPAVAMLRISIALRAEEHYDLIRKARSGRLDTEYRNKLGWLVGNLYSRIDTTDWSEKDSGESEERRIIGELLDTPVDGNPPMWVSPTWISAAKAARVNLVSTPYNQLQAVLKQHAPKPPLDLALAEVKRIIDQMRGEFMDKAAEAFGARFETDQCVLPLLAREITKTVCDVTGGNAWQFYESLASDAGLLGYVAARLRQRATSFANRNAARTLPLFIESLSAEPILSADAVGRVGMRAEEAIGADWLLNAGQINTTLLAMLPPAALVEHLRAVATSAVQESLADRTVAKLTNSTPFKKTLKPD